MVVAALQNSNKRLLQTLERGQIDVWQTIVGNTNERASLQLLTSLLEQHKQPYEHSLQMLSSVRKGLAKSQTDGGFAISLHHYLSGMIRLLDQVQQAARARVIR